MQLKQICNHPVQYLHQMAKRRGDVSLDNRSGKLERLGELLEEILERGRPGVDFYAIYRDGRDVGRVFAKGI